MTQVGEAVAISMQQELTCPMEHGQTKTLSSQPAKGEKDVEKLKSNLAKGMSTILFDPDAHASGDVVDKGLHVRLDEEPSPAILLIAQNPLPIKVFDRDYPISIAAHHIIPGEDGLPKTSLAKYIWKSEGSIFGDIGYHVDGAENGVWLPTHQALSLGMSAGDIQVQAQSSTSALQTSKYSTLSKSRAPFIVEYTRRAMDLIGAQFHDAHKDYSKKVVRMMDTIHLWISKASSDCKDCEKSKSPDGKLPPPYFLVYRLNALSRRLRGVLTGHPSVWKDGYFTSSYAKEYKKHLKQGSSNG